MTFSDVLEVIWFVLVMILSVALIAAIPAIWVVGQFQKKARFYIARAADFTREGRFSEARHAVKIATRLNGSIRNNPDAVSLYRIILSGSMEGQHAEVERVRRASEAWPKTRWEEICEAPAFRVIVAVLGILVLVYRLSTIK